MDILSGSFGKGSAQLLGGSLHVRIVGLLFPSNVEYPTLAIIAVEALGGHSKKKVGEAVGFAGTGAVVGSLLGPIGALVGAAAGALAGGKADHVTFSCRLSDGKSFVARGSASEFFEMQSAASSGTTPVEEPERSRRKSRRRAQSDAYVEEQSRQVGAKALPGRARARAPSLDNPFLRQLKAMYAESSDVVMRRALRPLTSYIDSIHETKWRYLGPGLEDLEVNRIVMLRVVIEEQKAANLLQEAQESRQIEQRDRSEAHALRKNPPSYSGPDGHMMPLEYYTLPLVYPSDEWDRELRRRFDLGPHAAGWFEKIDGLEYSASKHERIALSKEQDADQRKSVATLLIEVARLTERPKELMEFRGRCVEAIGSGQLVNLDDERPSTQIALKFLQLPQVHLQPSSDGQASSGTVKERLIELKSLLDEGLISDSEFAEFRNNILRAV